MPLLLICVLAVVAMRNLFAARGYPTTHDSLPHMARILNIDEALKDGQWPPLWGGRLMGGIGSPVLMLNYQLPYYIIIVLMRLGKTPIDAYLWTLIITYMASGIAMYWALSRRYKPWPAVVGSILYILATYRFVDIYVRGALGECVSFLFIPLILGAYWSKRNTLLILGLAGMFLSHPVGSFLISVFFGGMLLLDLIEKRRLGKIWKYVALYILAILISAYNIIPTLFLTKMTHYSPADSGTLLQFPTAKQLIRSDWGYGISTFDENDGMSFAIGYGQWLAFGLTFVVLVITARKADPGWRYGVYLLFSLGVAIFLMLDFSIPIYKFLHLTALIDFPWRILLLVVCLSALSSCWMLDRIGKGKLQVALGIALIAIAIYANRNHCRVDDVWRLPMSQYRIETGDAYGEYASITRDSRTMSSYLSRVTTPNDVAYTIMQDRSNELEFTTKSNEAQWIRINIMYFPGWKIYINGQLSECEVTKRSDPVMDDSGLIVCNLPAGHNVVRAKYEPLLIQRICNTISVLAFSGVVVWSMYRLFCRHITKKRQ